MKIKQSYKLGTKRWVVPALSFIVLILIFSLGFVLGRTGFNVVWKDGEVNYTIKGQLYPEEKELDFGLFWEVWDMLETRYVDEAIDEGDMFYGAIKGIVSSLNDPATRFLTPEETESYEFERAGKLEGIGIEMQYLNGEVVIKRTLDASPASNSGVLAGDIILKVDGEDVTDLSITEVASRIRGEKGTKVLLTVYRDDEDKELDFEIERDEIYVESIDWEMLEDQTAFISIGRFTEDSLMEFELLWDRVVSGVKAEDPSGLIIDLRGNGGGFLDGAVYVAGEFLEREKVVLYIEDREGENQAKKVERDGIWTTIPVVILVDSNTASSSEIFAGALQYYNRAQIVGEETFGKGSAQDVIKPSSWGGSSIHLTTQKWLLPDKRWISSDNPILPDFKVDITVEQIKNGDDPQLDKALELIRNL
jgi:carboxyl-terminal processing protease